MSFVTVSLVGNLARQPELMSFASGRVRTTLIVATDWFNHRTNLAKTDYYRVETWGKLAELAGRYLHKGNQVTVSGRLVFDHWTDKNGHSRITPVVKATQVALPPKAREEQGDQPAEPDSGCNPIGGEVILTDQEGGADPTYASPPEGVA